MGLTETQAKAQGIEFEKAVFPWAASGRALATGRDEGMTKLLFDKNTPALLGAAIVGPNAGELIAETVLALEMGADAADIWASPSTRTRRCPRPCSSPRRSPRARSPTSTCRRSCGTPTQIKGSERVRQCPACGQVHYPRLAPAVMALVRRGDELLLARSPHFPPGMHSALAGFVEPGESLEQCLHREVKEEVGVDVTNLRYFSSQPWPFPHSLMIAFTCDYAGGQLTPQPDEIEAAQWFTLDALPVLPNPISIARRLIDATIAQMRAQN
jgi:ADP-ribose pyrophosphatase YjhB (NUDIX family)